MEWYFHGSDSELNNPPKHNLSSLCLTAYHLSRRVERVISAACAEFIADIFLSPLDSTRIRQVSDAEMASMSMPQAFGTILKRDGFITGFYSGFVPLLFKQIPYTTVHKSNRRGGVSATE